MNIFALGILSYSVVLWSKFGIVCIVHTMQQCIKAGKLLQKSESTSEL